jgi:hypothetical protein
MNYYQLDWCTIIDTGDPFTSPNGVGLLEFRLELC